MSYGPSQRYLKEPQQQRAGKIYQSKDEKYFFRGICHFLANMFGIISKSSLKMQRNDLILPVAVSLLHETVTNIQVLKSRPAPNGHLKRYMNIFEESQVDNEMQFQGNMLKGSLDGTPKRGGAHPDSLQSSMAEAIDMCLNTERAYITSLRCSACQSQIPTGDQCSHFVGLFTQV